MCAVFPGGAPLRKSFALHRSRDLLPPSAKEATHELGRLVLADAAIDFRPMQAGRAGKIPDPVFDRSTLAIGRPEIEAPDARERDCCRAHGAGLERHVEIAIEQPFVAEGSRGMPDRQHLGMRGRVVVRDGAVRRLRDQVSRAHDHAAHRNLAGLRCRLRLRERERHEGKGHSRSMRRRDPRTRGKSV